MIDTHVQTAFDALLRFLQFLAIVWQLSLLRRQQAALPPATPKPLALSAGEKPARKPAKKKPAKTPRR